MKNKVLAMLLALCMVMSLLPVSVFAADKVGDGETTCETCGCAFTAECGCAKAVAKDPEDENSQAKDAVCGCAKAEKPCGCEGCKAEACQPKETCADPDCTNTGKEHVKGEHTYACACKKDADGKPHTDCKNTSTTNGNMCDDCYAKGHSTSAPVCTESSAKDDNCAVKDVKDATHTVNCVSRCTSDTACDSKVHTEDCPIGKVDGKKVLSASYDAKYEIACMCDLHHVDGGHGKMLEDQKTAAECPNKVTITKTMTIVWEPKEEEKKEEAGAKAADPLPETEAAAKAKADEALAKEIGDAQKDAKTKKTYLCDACKAAQVGVCDGTIDCEALAHTNTCLTKCNMGKDCPNEAGNVAAHKVLYVVKVKGSEDVEKDTRTDAVKYVNGEIQKKKDALKEAEKALEEDDGKDASKTAGLKSAVEDAKKALKEEPGKYTIIEKHCESLGIPDSSTVVSVEEAEAAGNATGDDKTEEPKAPEKAEDLVDVDGTEWFAEELTALIEKGIFVGKLDDGKYSFGAKDEMNTDMLVVLVSRVLDKGLVTTGADWAKEATAWAAEEGLTEGIESGKVTRGDVVLVLWRAAGSPKSEASLEKFVDAEGLEGDQLAAMKWAVENEIIKGNDKNELNAGSVIIRSEMVAVIARFDGVVNK